MFVDKPSKCQQILLVFLINEILQNLRNARHFSSYFFCQPIQGFGNVRNRHLLELFLFCECCILIRDMFDCDRSPNRGKKWMDARNRDSSFGQDLNYIFPRPKLSLWDSNFYLGQGCQSEAFAAESKSGQSLYSKGDTAIEAHTAAPSRPISFINYTGKPFLLLLVRTEIMLCRWLMVETATSGWGCQWSNPQKGHLVNLLQWESLAAWPTHMDLTAPCSTSPGLQSAESTPLCWSFHA